ncbi:MAG: DNA-formamidopyrimidine glycosylase family protein [Ilumatobacteraceae bacterium]
MPEGLEVELYRRAALGAIGRVVQDVTLDGSLAQPGFADAALGRRFTDVHRIGKLLLLATDGPTLGFHFGMTGRLVLDGHAPIERLEYAGDRDEPRWDRLRLVFADGGVLRVNDPRRWARFSIDPDVAPLGPDLFSVTRAELAAVLRRRRTALKAVLLDQHAIAGLGNMLVDELLWHAGLDPRRIADSVTPRQVGRLHATMSEHLPAMLERGGSHTGALSPEVRACHPPCPRDGRGLSSAQVGGRTTVWCAYHQR